MKKMIFISLGLLTFVLGTIGIFLPILPTTVFYLLTAFFWMRSSDYLYGKFVASNYYQKYIQETLIQKKITPYGQLKLFVTIFIVFAIPCLIVRNMMMSITLSIVFIAHVIFLSFYFRRKKTNTPSIASEKLKK